MLEGGCSDFAATAGVVAVEDDLEGGIKASRRGNPSCGLSYAFVLDAAAFSGTLTGFVGVLNCARYSTVLLLFNSLSTSPVAEKAINSLRCPAALLALGLLPIESPLSRSSWSLKGAVAGRGGGTITSSPGSSNAVGMAGKQALGRVSFGLNKILEDVGVGDRKYLELSKLIGRGDPIAVVDIIVCGV